MPTPAVAARLLKALGDCGEWPQLAVMAALERHADDATRIVAAVAPRLQHANAAVVLGAARVVLLFAPRCDEDVKERAIAKLAPALVAVASSPQPGLQWVGLRTLLLVCEHCDALLPPHAAKLFSVRFNDAPCVKAAKLDLLVALASDANAEEVLDELAALCRREVDAGVVRRALRAVPRVVLAVPSMADHAVLALSSLLRAVPALLPCVLPALADLSRVISGLSLAAAVMDAAACAALSSVYDAEASSTASPAEAVDAALQGDDDAEDALWYLVGAHVRDEAVVRRTAVPLLQSASRSGGAPPEEALCAAVRLHAREPHVVPADVPLALLLGCATDRAAVYARLIAMGDRGALLRVVDACRDPPRRPALRPWGDLAECDSVDPLSFVGTTAALLPADPLGRPLRLGRKTTDGMSSPAMRAAPPRDEPSLPDLLDLDGAGSAKRLDSPFDSSPPAVDLLGD
jgi:hypothetical protein